MTIDWDDLEMALTWRDAEGGGHFFDLRTGEVIVWSRDDNPARSEEIDDGLAQGRLLPIEPLPSSVEYGWMEEFVATVRSADLRRRLAVALGGTHPFRRFKDVLASHPAEREQWFAFHRERLRDAAREWLEENGIQDPPRCSVSVPRARSRFGLGREQRRITSAGWGG